jgi:hypothetical protein
MAVDGAPFRLYKLASTLQSSFTFHYAMSPLIPFYCHYRWIQACQAVHHPFEGPRISPFSKVGAGVSKLHTLVRGLPRLPTSNQRRAISPRTVLVLRRLSTFRYRRSSLPDILLLKGRSYSKNPQVACASHPIFLPTRHYPTSVGRCFVTSPVTMLFTVPLVHNFPVRRADSA